MVYPTHRPETRRRGLGALALAGAMAVAATAIAPVTSFAQDAPAEVATSSGDLGTYLVDPEGMTLYFFTNDVTPGVSTCEGGCLDVWPPLLVADGEQLVGDESVTGTLATITRSDGSQQAAYRGRPLYRFANDTAPGDTNGQGVKGIWFVASVDGTVPEEPPTGSEEPAALTLETGTSDLGTFLTGRDGLTIYYFAQDTTPGFSTCEGGCLGIWPPVSVPAGGTVAAGDGVTGVLGSITGNDGSTQVTYDGHPLYYFASDEAAGDTNGQGVKGVWFVADVSGSIAAR